MEKRTHLSSSEENGTEKNTAFWCIHTEDMKSIYKFAVIILSALGASACENSSTPDVVEPPKETPKTEIIEKEVAKPPVDTEVKEEAPTMKEEHTEGGDARDSHAS